MVGRYLVLTEPQSIIFGKLKNTKKQTVKAEYYEFYAPIKGEPLGFYY